MISVLTLVSHSRLTARLLAPFYALPQINATVTRHDGCVVDFFVFNVTKAQIATLIGTSEIDYCLQPLKGRRKKLLIADMDSTMIGQECIDELADFMGKKAEVSEITERAMRGELPFEPALKQRVLLLKGLPVSVVDEVIATRITLNKGAIELISTMKKAGAYTALVSGGFTLFTSKVAAMIGFDENRANILLHENGFLTGEVQMPILGKEAKLASLLELCAARNIALSETLAVGDGANDLMMIEASGLGVAYYAKPKVAEAAHCFVKYTDLRTLLYFQGY
jgi:phosphoserine phosphatase